MNEGGNHPEWQAEGAVGCRQAGELLQTSQYEQVAALLHIAQTKSAQAGDIVLTHLLDAARLLCVSLIACHAEAERHRQACQETELREQYLRQELHAILDLLGKGEMPHALSAPKQLPRISAPPAERPQRHSLWKRIQGLLRHRTSSLPSRREQADTLPTAAIQPHAIVPHPVLTEIQLPAAAKTSSAAETQPVKTETLRYTGDTRPSEAEMQPSAAAASPSQSLSKEPNLATDTASPPRHPDEQTSPTLAIYCLGQFRVYQDDQPVEEWLSSKGKSIFKHLVTHRQHPTAKEVLMELFWPEREPDAARNNLNVAIYGLRQALRQVHPNYAHVLFENDHYFLDSKMQIWVDCEAFEEHIAAARDLERREKLEEAIHEYRAAETLYQGEFLEEDRYEEWILPQRQHLKRAYLELLDRLSRYSCEQRDHSACITLCHKTLAVDPCREEAHRRLMRCYCQQGQPYLALRQYHLCVEDLRKELDVPPSPETIRLYEQIRSGKLI